MEPLTWKQFKDKVDKKLKEMNATEETEIDYIDFSTDMLIEGEYFEVFIGESGIVIQ